MTIHINLLPASYFQAKRKKQVVILGIAGGIFGVLAFLGFNAWQAMQLNRVKTQIRAVDEDITRYQVILQEIDRIKQTKAMVESREHILKTLAVMQGYWPKLLNDLVRAIPSTVWIRTLTSSSVGDVRNFSLAGQALTKQSVSDFLLRLQFMIPGVEIKGVQQITESPAVPIGAVDFQMTFSVKR